MRRIAFPLPHTYFHREIGDDAPGAEQLDGVEQSLAIESLDQIRSRLKVEALADTARPEHHPLLCFPRDRRVPTMSDANMPTGAKKLLTKDHTVGQEDEEREKGGPIRIDERPQQ
jgi:hypothetical protein